MNIQSLGLEKCLTDSMIKSTAVLTEDPSLDHSTHILTYNSL